MISHTRFDAFVFVLCGPLAARWRDSNRKSAPWWEPWTLKLRRTNLSGCNTLILCFYWLLVVLEHKALFSFLFLHDSPVRNQQGSCFCFCCLSGISSITYSSLVFCESTLKL